MNQRIEVSALFYAGKLFQIGDIVKGKGEYLDNGNGFTKYDTGGRITKIIIEPDTVCNSLYLNHGLTYNSIGGLGYAFELDGVKHYAFENKTFVLPYKVQEKRDYFTAYYNHSINSDKLENLLLFLKTEHKRELTTKEVKKLGTIIYKEYRQIFDYFFLCLNIRAGNYGIFHDNNELSSLTSKILRDNGLNNNTTNYLHKLTVNNSRNPKTNNSYFKSKNP